MNGVPNHEFAQALFSAVVGLLCAAPQYKTGEKVVVTVPMTLAKISDRFSEPIFMGTPLTIRTNRHRIAGVGISRSEYAAG